MKKLTLTKVKNIIIVCILILLLCSLFFASVLEYVFKLRPNLTDIGSDALVVHFVDVGQGNCTLVELPNDKTMLIDSGTTKSIDKLTNYINNVFFYKKTKRFDYVVLTHSDSDHSGGMEQIIKDYDIGTFYRPRIFSPNVDEAGLDGMYLSSSECSVYDGVLTELALHTNIEIKYNNAGITITNGSDTCVSWYSPNKTDYDNVNDFSPIMVIEYCNQKIAVSGDATSEVEQYVVNNYDLPDVDVLSLGHHGSNTSSCASYLEALKPEQVIISVGTNSYGHPSSYVLDRLVNYDNEYNKNTYNTRLTTLDKGNIVCYVNTNSTYKITTISNVDNYLFISWYYVVFCGGLACVILIFVPLSKIHNSKSKIK